ncbi:MAG: glycine zipper domain-containing protein [Verrucomicrobiota bacterium]
MNKNKIFTWLVMGSFVFALVGCQTAPGTRNQQGAVIGGAAGAAAGAAVSKNNRLLGAVIGGALGAGGGYVIANKTDKANSDPESATRAVRKSQEQPATAEDARRANTADLNNDGFVTLDEVVALREAGFSDAKMLDYLRVTEQVFDLNSEQQQYLASHGVSQNVITQMAHLNTGNRNGLPNERHDVISEPNSR